jgi:hypothetical protein
MFKRLARLQTPELHKVISIDIREVTEKIPCCKTICEESTFGRGESAEIAGRAIDLNPRYPLAVAFVPAHTLEARPVARKNTGVFAKSPKRSHAAKQCARKARSRR